MCCTASLSTGTDTLLKIYLKSARRMVRFHDKLALLEQGMPNQGFSKMLKFAFFKAINDADQRYHSPPYFGDVSDISPEEAKLPQKWKQAVSIFGTNKKSYTDPFGSFFGVSKEQFEKDYQAWLRKNP